MNEPAKNFFNGHTQIYLRIASLSFQGLIVAGVFWVGATFVRKVDFEAYKTEQRISQEQRLEAEYKRSELFARLEERLRALQDSSKKP